MTKLIPLFTLLLILSPSLMAGTVVEILSDNELTTVMTDGKQARMNVSASEYVIVDYKNNSVKFISHPDKEVMLLDTTSMPSGNSAPVVKTSIDNLGSGKSIAGYKTQKFSYSADGKSCGIVYGSKDAYQAEGIKELFAAIKTMMEKQQAMMGGYTGMIDPCTFAEMKMSEHVNIIGVPMQTEENGKVSSEVKSIKVGVTLPADTFDIPASYKTVTMKEKMGDMRKRMQQQMQPQMEDMMRQMQKSGQMTPEMMEQMRQAQEMMKQSR